MKQSIAVAGAALALLVIVTTCAARTFELAIAVPCETDPSTLPRDRKFAKADVREVAAKCSQTNAPFAGQTTVVDPSVPEKKEICFEVGSPNPRAVGCALLT